MEHTGADQPGRAVRPRHLVPEAGEPFDRIVCGIDGSDEAILAARQARQVAPNVPVILVHAISVIDHAYRRDYPSWIHTRRDGARRLLDETAPQLAIPGAPPPDITVEEGDIPDALGYVANRTGRPLLSIGSGDDTERRLHSSGPAPTGARLILRIVEAAPCSVLVARRTPQSEHFPRSIAVGVDGSEASLYAYRIATRIAEHAHAATTAIVALGGKGADLQSLQQSEPPMTPISLTEGRPVKALLDAAGRHDLIVVGNRGLHGLRSLGSVSNRVVTSAPTSVLVIRRPRRGT